MSDRPCNRCEFDRLKYERERRGHKIEARPEPVSGWPRAMRVYQDGKPIGILYMALSEECAC